LEIELEVGGSRPVTLSLTSDNMVTECRGPGGLPAANVAMALEQALAAPLAGPPLAAHVVPGDRVVVAVAGDLPGPSGIEEDVAGVIANQLAAAGVSRENVRLVTAPRLNLLREAGAPDASADHSASLFQPACEPELAYLMADNAGDPLHLARTLVDADVVVTAGGFFLDASLGGRSPEGEAWPAFGSVGRRGEFFGALLRRGRRALPAWRTQLEEVVWQLGATASLRLVPGCGDSISAAVFGSPPAATRAAARASVAWRPDIAAPADLLLGGVRGTNPGLATIIRAVAAAARVTRPTGTICLAGRLAERPGPIFTRWRHGADLGQLIREAIASRDPATRVDALQTRLLARALGDRRLVLLSELPADLVEDLDIGHAADSEALERLARQANRVIVLHEADRFCPRLV
jgi:hypothetical protein